MLTGCVMARIRRPRKTYRPKRKVKRICSDCSSQRLEEAAHRAVYEGSPYHRNPKAGRIPASRRYPAASKCDQKWTLDLATKALQEAIRAGLVSDDWRGDFPRYAWYQDGLVLYEAVLSNQERGSYHGYPLNGKEEWPQGLEK